MNIQKTMLGAGCFWGVEHLLRKINGVVKTSVGYAGGSLENPTYAQVCTGKTGHAEVVLVEFDPSIITYEEILDVFFRLHDPTTLNRQHNDIGTQYRSVIFTFDENQKNSAEEMIKKINARNVFQNPVVTEVSPAMIFYPAEDYHQDYLLKNPDGYMCHILKHWPT